MENSTSMKPSDALSKDLHISCQHCMLDIDATGKPPFSTISCPTCGTDVIVPMQFGDYLLNEKIGEGAITTAYRTFDSVLNRKAIVKILNKKLNDDHTKRNLFLEVGKHAVDIQANHIQATYACSEHNGSAFMLTADLAGGHLESFLELNTTKKISVQQAMEGLQQLIEAADHLHTKGITLGKIKPHDILFDNKGSMYLTDIGLTDLRPDENASSTEWGTEFYANPEQVLGREITTESDYYSLGAIFYHLLAGTPPFMGRNREETLQMRVMTPPKPLHTLNPEVPVEFSQLIMKLLAVFPAERGEAVANLANTLRAVSANNNTSAARGHKIKMEGGASKVEAPTAQSKLPTAQPSPRTASTAKSKRLGPPRPSVGAKACRIVIDIIIMLAIFFAADYFLNGADFGSLIGLNAPAYNFVAKEESSKVATNEETQAVTPTDHTTAPIAEPVTHTEETVALVPPTKEAESHLTNSPNSEVADTTEADQVEEEGTDTDEGEIEDVAINNFNLRDAEGEHEDNEEPVIEKGKSDEEIAKLLNTTPRVRRPLPKGLDFVSIKTKLKTYVNAYKTNEEKRRERARLNTLSGCKKYLAGLVGHQPYQLSGGIRIKVKGRTYRGKAVLGNVNEIILRGKSKRSKIKKFKWKDFEIKQFVSFLDFYMRLLEKQVDMASSREKNSRQKDASYHAYRVALLCDWFGLKQKAKRFAMISVRYDDTIKRKMKIMVPYMYKR